MAMKQIIFILSLFTLLIGITSSTSISFPNASNKAFKAGEKLKYLISYGFIDAGEAILEVNSTTKKEIIGIYFMLKEQEEH